jgi:hypothetical protein
VKANIENWSLVLAGAWNTAILTPEWLTKHLGVDGGSVQIEFPIGNPLLPIRYTFQNVRMVVVRDRLIIAPNANDPTVLARAETFAKKILNTLTHTPMSAVGVNFDFIEADAPTDLKNLFRAQDSTKLAGADFVVEATELRRQLRRGQGEPVVNLTLRQAAPEIAIHVNFHKDAPDAASAAAYLDGRIMKCRDLTMKFLHDVYSLDLEETPQS